MTKYIDVTRLVEWPGSYTGMERMAYEITRSFLNKSKDVRLCIASPEGGFLDLENNYHFKDGRLITTMLTAPVSLRTLIKTDRSAFTSEYIKRKKQSIAQRQLKKVRLNSDDILLVMDGLWDRQGYIDSIIELVNSGGRLAHVVHDLVPVVMPQVCFDFVTIAFDNYFKQISPKIDILFSISKNTEEDFNSVYGEKLKKSVTQIVIRHGEDFGSNEEEEQHVLGLNKHEYILSAGTLEARKNHQLLYQAYRMAIEKEINLPKLIIVGREGWLSEPVTYAFKNDPLVKNNVVIAGPVNDSQLKWLYKNCLFSVFPSLYEGWGLPVAESLYYGKVCACSSSSSLKEIGGDLNVYFSPYDSSECLETIVKLLDDRTRSEIEKRIKTDYKTTTWDQSAAKISRYLNKA